MASQSSTAARARAAEQAKRWQLWYWWMAFIGIYGVNALFGEILRLVGASGWNLEGSRLFVTACVLSIGLTVYRRRRTDGSPPA